jgi:uncharacterized protein (DUF2141 family)
MDSSLIGLPEEPYGFSNDAAPGLGEPAFTRTQFHVSAGDSTTVTIHLMNSDAKTAQASHTD